MCNVQSDDLSEMEKRPPAPSLLDHVCKKCGIEKGIVVLRVNDVYCKSCFVPYFVHKFRSSLGKSKLMKSGDLVLVSHSGGQASSCMLHLIKDAMEDDNKKKLKYSTVVLYIDEGSALEQSQEERIGYCRDAVELASTYGFPIYYTTLEMIYKVDDAYSHEAMYQKNNGEPIKQLPTDEALEKRLKDLFSSVTSLTAKEDLLLRLRHQLICKIGEKLECNKVFLGDSGTRLSVRLLADIAQGRGAQLTEDTGFSHNWGSQIMVLRPMREFVTKEIAVYNNIHGIGSICIPTLATKADHRASIVRLSEQFMHGLQLDFPSTVSTVFRTGEKLCTNQDFGREKCIFCQGTFDVQSREDSAAKSTEFSQYFTPHGKPIIPEVEKLNLYKTTQFEEQGDCCSTRDSNSSCACAANALKTDETRSPRRVTREELIPYLCYGCRVVVRDMKDVHAIPESVHEEAYRRNQRAKMKHQISDCLFDDSDE